MTENRRQVLEMLSSGKITTDEADRLLHALGDPDPGGFGGTATAVRPAPPKYIRVIVESLEKGGPVKVNVRVPVMLLRAGVKLAGLIPPVAQERLNQELRKNGLTFDISQVKPENVDELIDQLRDLTIDVEQEHDNVRVKVFCEGEDLQRVRPAP